jgi:hypothetical protein
MTPDAPPDALERALAVTQRLRALVEAGDWGGAAELERERRELLEAFFARRPSAEELARVLGQLRELIQSNDLLIGLTEHRQRVVALEADLLATGVRATRAYGVVA